MAKREAEKKASHRKYTSEAREKTSLLLLLIVALYQKNWPVASYLVMRKALLPEPCFKKPEASRLPTEGQSFSMKLLTSPMRFRSRSYASFRNEKCARWVEPVILIWM